MEYTQIIKKKLFLISTLIFCYNCYAQSSGGIPDGHLYGRWKCVKLDTRGYQKYSLEQAHKLQASILTIETHTFYYNNINFIEQCNFYRWGINKYDTVHLHRNTLEITYTNKELSKIQVLEPLDSNGKFGCFNNCAIFYLKGDTLINNCGGYILFLIKIPQGTSTEGDTVKCMYGSKCHSTGYVIQGTRAKGNVIHVKPINKNVPVEQTGSGSTKGG
jgi:hypothetical protein